jgi:hypothetical protein
MPSAHGTAGARRSMILVEGVSDQRAVLEVARLRGDQLAEREIDVVAMDGVTNLPRYLHRYGPLGLGFAIAGLCDAAEAAYVGRALHRAGMCPDPSPQAMRACGFFLCTRDLEDELIRAAGAAAVQAVIAAEGERRSWRTLQRQPAQRERSTVEQLRRFLAGRAGNKHRYAALLARALEPATVPPPLADLLDHVTDTLPADTETAPIDPAEA